MKIHPIAELFPMLGKEELAELANDIKENGLQQAIVMLGDTLLDGRNRMAACKVAGIDPRFETYKGESPVSFIIGANLHRRHLEKSQRAALGVEIEPELAKEAKKRQRGGQGGVLLPVKVPEAKGDARDQAAAAVKVSGKMVSDAKAIKGKSPEKFKEIMAGKKTVARAKKEVKAEEDEHALAKAQLQMTAEKRKSLESVCNLRVCSCRELFQSGIKPDAVITDPPYPQEFLSVFSELAESCKVALVPLVAVMSGQTYLPEVLKRLCEHLTYRWTLAYLTPGGQAVQQFPAKINTFWKPVLLFGTALEWIGDVTRSDVNDNDKNHHVWGQSESGMADLIVRLTKPGQLICDPFLGGGTTAVVSLALGRKFVGCDIDKSCVEKARQRVEAQSCQK